MKLCLILHTHPNVRGLYGGLLAEWQSCSFRPNITFTPLQPEPFPHWTFTTKLRLMQGKQKKTTGYPMVPHIYCPFRFRSLFVFEGSRQRTFLGCIQKMGMGMQLQSFPYVAGFSSAWGQCHAVKVIICCSTQQRTGR